MLREYASIVRDYCKANKFGAYDTIQKASDALKNDNLSLWCDLASFGMTKDKRAMDIAEMVRVYALNRGM